MKEKKIIRFAILIFWTFFWGLSVMDKIIPDVHQLWVGKDFFALFIKFFGSLGLKDPIFATVALATVSSLEALNFVFYLLSFANFLKGNNSISEKWFFRAIFSSITLFSLFSIADQVFGDRFQLLEHGLFWLILIASWVLFKHISSISEKKIISLQPKKELKVALFTGSLITIIASFSIIEFSDSTFSNVNSAVEGHQVIEDVYKFDFPFLADKLGLEPIEVTTFLRTHKINNEVHAVDHVFIGENLRTRKLTATEVIEKLSLTKRQFQQIVNKKHQNRITGNPTHVNSNMAIQSIRYLIETKCTPPFF